MSFSRPIHWCHSHADPIWPDGAFKFASKFWPYQRLIKSAYPVTTGSSDFCV